MPQKKSIVFLQDMRLGFTFRTEDGFDLMRYDVVNELTAVGQVLTRVEVVRMLSHVLADAGSQAETEVGVDVDLADRQGSSFAELIFRDADSVSQVAAVGVDDFDVFRYDRGSTVEYDREARQAFGNVFEDVEAERRRYENAVCVARALFRSEFECAVAGADSDSQGIDARAGYEFFDFFRTGVVSFFSRDVDIVFDAGQLAEFAFDDDALGMSVFNDFFSSKQYCLRKNVWSRRS